VIIAGGEKEVQTTPKPQQFLSMLVPHPTAFQQLIRNMAAIEISSFNAPTGGQFAFGH